jgi:VCBS repeat-containing protein
MQLSFSASELSGNDSAGPLETQSLTVTSITAGPNTHGTVTLINDTVTYTPEANYNGPASFSYTVCDDGTTGGSPDPKCTSGTVNVTVTAVNDPPIATGESYVTNSNTALNVVAPGVLGNDQDIDGGPLSAQLESDVSHGTLALNADGSFSYTPGMDYTGPDSFTYKAFDGSANSNVVTVTITVNDTVGPYLNSALATPLISMTNSNLINVGLTASATDNGGGPVNI